MSNEATKARIEKLPAWARSHIKGLERGVESRDDYIAKLEGKSKPRPGQFWQYYEADVCYGTMRDRPIEARSVTLECAGLEVTLTPRENDVRVYFHSKQNKTEAVLRMSASNCFSLRSAPVSASPRRR